MSPKSGEVSIIPIRTGDGGSTTLTEWNFLTGVLPSTPVWFTFHGILLTHVPPDAAYARTYFVAVVKSVCGDNSICATLLSILGFIVRTATGMVQLLNNFCSKFLLLV